MNFKPNSRRLKAATFLCKSPKQTFSLREIGNAIDAKLCLSIISSTVNGLYMDGLVAKTGERRGARYSANKALIQAVERTHALPVLADDQSTVAAKKKTKGKAKSAEPTPLLHLRKAGPSPRNMDSKGIAEDVAAFIARGGRIQKLNPGESSKHFGNYD